MLPLRPCVFMFFTVGEKRCIRVNSRESSSGQAGSAAGRSGSGGGGQLCVWDPRKLAGTHSIAVAWLAINPTSRYARKRAGAFAPDHPPAPGVPGQIETSSFQYPSILRQGKFRRHLASTVPILVPIRLVLAGPLPGVAFGHGYCSAARAAMSSVPAIAMRVNPQAAWAAERAMRWRRTGGVHLAVMPPPAEYAVMQ